MIASRPPTPLHQYSRTKRFGLALLVCLGATVIAAILHGRVDAANLAMIYLLAVLLVAANLGRDAAIVAVVVCVGSFDFLFVPPRLSLVINDFQYMITLVVMLVTAVVIAQLAAGLREHARDAEQREANTHALYDLTRKLAGTLTWDAVQTHVTAYLEGQLRMRSQLLRVEASGELEETPASAPILIDRHLARVALDSREIVRNDKDRGTGYATVYLPLWAESATFGVLALRLGEHPQEGGATDEALTLAQTVASIVSVVLDRVRLSDAAQTAAVETQTERLRGSILSALSHDVRTPLTAMVGLADSLFLVKPALPADALDTAQALREQADRLAGLVSNLLEMARLKAGAVRLRLEWQPVEEVIGSSLKLMGAALARHSVKLSIDPGLPLLNIDAVLIERVLCNLLDNAAKYSPDGSVIDLSVRRLEHAVEVTVADRGAGFQSENSADLFGMFVRGSSKSTAFGAGLGLSICKTIIDAHGGTIVAEDREDGGARVRFAIALGDPPTIEEEVA